MKLTSIKKNKKYIVKYIEDSNFKVNIIEFGIFPNQIVKFVYKAPFGGPIAILTGDLQGNVIAISRRESDLVIVEEI